MPIVVDICSILVPERHGAWHRSTGMGAAVASNREVQRMDRRVESTPTLIIIVVCNSRILLLLGHYYSISKLKQQRCSRHSQKQFKHKTNGTEWASCRICDADGPGDSACRPDDIMRPDGRSHFQMPRHQTPLCNNQRTTPPA